MLIFIVLLLLGAAMAYLSKFNAMPVSVNFGSYILEDIPLFYVIIGSLLIGLFLSYAVYLVDTLFISWTIRGKNKELKKNQQEALQLSKRIHQLELENERLKNGSTAEPKDDRAL